MASVEDRFDFAAAPRPPVRSKQGAFPVPRLLYCS